jgi:cysteine desulfurase
MSDWIYLDYNASTPMAPEVVSLMTECLQAQAHPSSKHPAGQKAGALVRRARQQVADSLQADPDEIVFCSGSTEAANHVIKGVAFGQAIKGEAPEVRPETPLTRSELRSDIQDDGFPTEPLAQSMARSRSKRGFSAGLLGDRTGPLHFITSAVDHAATIEPLRFLERLGHQVTLLEVDRRGRLTAEQVDQAIRPNTALVSLIHGQNEVGTLLPLEEVGQVCRARNVLFHVDAAQSYGKAPVSVNALKADFLQIAGHKIYAPKGVGALYIRCGRTLEPLLHGAGHESGARSGTPAPALIAGLGEACRLVDQHGLLSAEPADRLWEILSAQLGTRVRRNGHPEHRVPNVLHLTLEGFSGQELLDRARICASTGAACHSAAGSPVLSAMGFSPGEAAGSIRLSCGRQTTLEEAETAAYRLVEACQALAPG